MKLLCFFIFYLCILLFKITDKDCCPLLAWRVISHAGAERAACWLSAVVFAIRSRTTWAGGLRRHKEIWPSVLFLWHFEFDLVHPFLHSIGTVGFSWHLMHSVDLGLAYLGMNMCFNQGWLGPTDPVCMKSAWLRKISKISTCQKWCREWPSNRPQLNNWPCPAQAQECLCNLWSGNLGIPGLKTPDSVKGSAGMTGSSKWEYSGEPVLQPA